MVVAGESGRKKGKAPRKEVCPPITNLKPAFYDLVSLCSVTGSNHYCGEVGETGDS